MIADQIAKAAITIDAPIAKVWQALVDPDAIQQYMFGTNVTTDWREGSPIVWKDPTEEAREHSEENWEKMLAGLKRYLEQ